MLSLVPVGDRVAVDPRPPQPCASGAVCHVGGSRAPGFGPARRHLRRRASVAARLASRQLAGRQLDHERGAGEMVVLPARHGARQPLSAAAPGRGVGDARVALLRGGGAITRQQNLVPGLVVPDGHPWPDSFRQAPHRATLRLRERVRARVLAARPGRSSAPLVGEVAVQVDAPSVLAGAGLDAVRVDGLHDPQLDPSQVAVAVLEDVHDLLALGLVAVDRADNQRLARGVRIAQPHRVQLGPPHRVAKRHSPPEDPEAALGGRRVGDTARGERAHPERVPSAGEPPRAMRG